MQANSAKVLPSFKAAAVAYDPAWGDLDGNIERMVIGVENVAKQDVKLAVLPETANMGYIFDDFAMVRPFLDTVPGKTTDALLKVAQKYVCGSGTGRTRSSERFGLQHFSTDRSRRLYW
nr:nitrilase-related carbon-nitrogen hydrolase [Legionella drozanskii]